jgi:hypothetical protein
MTYLRNAVGSRSAVSSTTEVCVQTPANVPRAYRKDTVSARKEGSHVSSSSRKVT